MPKIITFGQQKGGTGKTTLTRELGIFLASTPLSPSGHGYRTLLLDTDPQGNLTRGLTDEEKRGVYHAFTDGSFDLQELRENLFLLQGSKDLARLERNLIGEVDAYLRLRSIFASVNFKAFDYILIDTPPNFGVMTLNALTASDYLAIVINPAIYTMQGTNVLLDTYTRVRDSLNSKLSILGAFVNALDNRLVIVREIMDELESHFGDLLVLPALSRSVKIEEAIPIHKGVVELGKSKVKTEIEQIGTELIRRTAL
jgi:chromosome partitioning protein